MAGMNAFGTKLMRGSTDPEGGETFTEVADITNVSGPSIEREEIDDTSHGSEGGWQEFLGGLKNGGEVTADVNYQPSVHDPLAADFDDAEPRTYKIVFPDADATERSEEHTSELQSRE